MFSQFLKLKKKVAVESFSTSAAAAAHDVTRDVGGRKLVAKIPPCS